MSSAALYSHNLKGCFEVYSCHPSVKGPMLIGNTLLYSLPAFIAVQPLSRLKFCCTLVSTF